MTVPLPSSPTFPQLLARALRTEPGRPFITAYDEAQQWRIELSVTTYANWVNKTANLLVDEYLLGEGDTILIDLDSHWLVPVFLGAAWSAGIAVTADRSVASHLIVTGPEIAEHHLKADLPVIASSLDGFAGRLNMALPDGVDDYGAMWPGQPDTFHASPPPDGMTAAWRHPETSESHDDLVARARAELGSRQGARVLTARHLMADSAVPTLWTALLVDGSLITVANPSDAAWGERYDSERPTEVLV